MEKEEAVKFIKTLREIIEASFELHNSPFGEDTNRKDMEDSLERKYSYLAEIITEEGWWNL